MEKNKYNCNQGFRLQSRCYACLSPESKAFHQIFEWNVEFNYCHFLSEWDLLLTLMKLEKISKKTRSNEQQ
jgi:hypothetical protein